MPCLVLSVRGIITAVVGIVPSPPPLVLIIFFAPSEAPPPVPSSAEHSFTIPETNAGRFSADDTVSTAGARHRALAWEAALCQTPADPLPLGEQVARLVAVGSGSLDDAIANAEEDSKRRETAMALLDAWVAHARREEKALLDVVSASGDISEEKIEYLKSMARAFFSGNMK